MKIWRLDKSTLLLFLTEPVFWIDLMAFIDNNTLRKEKHISNLSALFYELALTI